MRRHLIIFGTAFSAMSLVLAALPAAAIAADDAAGGRIKFKEPRYYELQSWVWGQVSADVDQDGDPDLVTHGPGRMEVATNDGRGNFAVAHVIDLKEQNTLLDPLDLDGDSDPDLVAIEILRNARSRLSIVRGASGATFEPDAPELMTGSIFSAVTIDLDGDLDMDLALSVRPEEWSPETEIRLFSNDGTGAFAAEGVIPLGQRRGSSLIGADLNGDGAADLVSTHWNTGEVEIRLGHGDFGFQAPSKLDLSDEIRSLVAADLNVDGNVDVLAELPTEVALLRGAGDGTFSPPKTYEDGGSSGRIRVVDVDLDGRLDLVSGAYSPNIVVLRGRAHGFKPLTFPAPPWCLDPVVADVDLDGRVDVVPPDGQHNPRLVVLLNRS